MKKRNGKYYRRFKSATGRVYWVEMKPGEITEMELYRATVVLTPLIMIAVMAKAAGMI